MFINCATTHERMRGSTSLIGSKASIIVSVCIRRSAIKHQLVQIAASRLRDLVFVESRQGHHKVYPYLLRKLAITHFNQVWALDTTYVPMARGFVYLTAVVDVASRKVLAHKVAITLEAVHATDVIEQAFARYGTPEIVNTDQGSQFTAEEFTRSVLDRGCKLSMDGRGAWRDNVFVERLWRSVKYERVYLKGRPTDAVSAARADIADYLDWYNARRPHSSVERLTPAEKYVAELPTMKLAA